MTNHVDNTNVWSLSIELFQDTGFQFYLNGSWDNQFGAPEPATVTIPGLNIPVTNSACGKSDFTLSDVAPGTFFFALDVSNATFTVTQTATNSAGALASVTAVGNFVEGTPPDINWRKSAAHFGGRFHRHQYVQFRLSFIGRDANGLVMRYWGVTNSRRWPATTARCCLPPAMSIPMSPSPPSRPAATASPSTPPAAPSASSSATPSSAG
jgi:hypothetical protein